MTYILRDLELNDYYLGILELYSQLTIVSKNISFEQFQTTFDRMSGRTVILVNSSTPTQIIGMGKLFIEIKIDGKKMGHIEDIVIDSNYRGIGLGKKIINSLIQMAKVERCYKISLNCNFDKIGFYKKNGFVKKGAEMTYYLSENFV